MKSERIQKILANLGLGSRRQIEGWIQTGRIRVNGKIAQLGDTLDEHDTIMLDGKTLELSASTTIEVLIYNKPEGEVCTRSDESGRQTVFHRLPKPQSGRWIMVGRLDLNTQGLLLFTNDGELAARLMHPRYQIEREYAARVLGSVTPEILKTLKTGVSLDDGPARFEHIQFQGGKGANQWYHVTLTEGRNREVRRLFESQGLQVSRLMRIRFGNIKLPKDLPKGHSQIISPQQLNHLKQAVKL